MHGQGHFGGRMGQKEEFLDFKHKNKKGTIIIEFYKTEQFERKSRPNQVHTKQYEQHFIEDSNKKSFAESIRIKEGKTFELPPSKNGRGGGLGGVGGAPPMRFANNFNSHRIGNNNNQNDFNRKRDSKFDEKRHYGQQNNFNRTLNVNGGGSFNNRFGNSNFNK